MSGKKTLIIAVVFALVVGGYLFDQRRRETKQERVAEESRLIAPKAEALTGLTVTNPSRGEPTVRLVKEDRHWKLAEPVRARADRSTVDSILNQLDSAEREDPFPVEAGKLADFGLEKPAFTVAFSTGDGSALPVLALGDRTPDENGVYARLGEQNEVFTLKNNLVTQLGASSMQLRDKRPLPANLTQATTLTLAHEGETFRLEKREGKWRLLEPLRTDADANAVSSLLSTWNNAKSGSFIDEPKDAAAYGLDTPYLAASAYVDGDDGTKTYAMMVGDINSTATANQARYSRQEGETTVFAISEDTVKKMLPTLDGLRSKELFTLAGDDVARLDLKMLKHRLPLEKGEGGTWRFHDEPDTGLDQTTIRQKVNALVGLNAMKFFAPDLPDQKTGLSEPNMVATVTSADGTTSQTIATGRKADDGDWVYSRFTTSDGRDEVVGIDWTMPGQFFLTREDVMDKSIVGLDAETVRSVTIVDGGTSIALTRLESGAWEGRMAEAGAASGEAFKVEPGTMDELLYAAAGLEWKRRLDPANSEDRREIEHYRLETPARVAIFRDADGGEIARLGEGGDTDDRAFVSGGAHESFTAEKFRMTGYRDALRSVLSAAGARLKTIVVDADDAPAESAPVEATP
jgi:hypothetical protein